MTDRDPKLDELADDEDTLGWDRDEHGKFVDFATGRDEEPSTFAYVPGVDD